MSFSCLSMHVWGEGESVSKRHFLVRFCIWKIKANCSAWFIFPCLIPHFLLRHFLAKCSFPSSVCPQQSCQCRRLTKTGPSASSRKIEKFIQQDFHGGISYEYPCTVKSSHGVHHNTVMQYVLFWILICLYQRVMTSWMHVLFAYQNMCTTLKLQLWHLIVSKGLTPRALTLGPFTLQLRPCLCLSQAEHRLLHLHL